MDPQKIQTILTAKFEGDHIRIARTAHFMGLIKSGIDGMASLGVVIDLVVDGLVAQAPRPPGPDPLSSLDLAIALMQEASTHATHES